MTATGCFPTPVTRCLAALILGLPLAACPSAPPARVDGGGGTERASEDKQPAAHGGKDARERAIEARDAGQLRKAMVLFREGGLAGHGTAAARDFAAAAVLAARLGEAAQAAENVLLAEEAAGQTQDGRAVVAGAIAEVTAALDPASEAGGAFLHGLSRLSPALVLEASVRALADERWAAAEALSWRASAHAAAGQVENIADGILRARTALGTLDSPVPASAGSAQVAARVETGGRLVVAKEAARAGDVDTAVTQFAGAWKASGNEDQQNAVARSLLAALGERDPDSLIDRSLIQGLLDAAPALVVQAGEAAASSKAYVTLTAPLLRTILETDHANSQRMDLRDRALNARITALELTGQLDTLAQTDPDGPLLDVVLTLRALETRADRLGTVDAAPYRGRIDLALEEAHALLTTPDASGNPELATARGLVATILPVLDGEAAARAYGLLGSILTWPGSEQAGLGTQYLARALELSEDPALAARHALMLADARAHQDDSEGALQALLVALEKQPKASSAGYIARKAVELAGALGSVPEIVEHFPKGHPARALLEGYAAEAAATAPSGTDQGSASQSFMDYIRAGGSSLDAFEAEFARVDELDGQEVLALLRGYVRAGIADPAAMPEAERWTRVDTAVSLAQDQGKLALPMLSNMYASNPSSLDVLDLSLYQALLARWDQESTSLQEVAHRILKLAPGDTRAARAAGE